MIQFIKTNAFILSTVCLCFCAGCNPNVETLKINALNQKLDYLTQTQVTVCSNQVALFAEIEATRIQVQRLHDFTYGLHTNLLHALALQENSIEYNLNRSIATSSLICLSNSEEVMQTKIQIDNIQANQFDMSLKVNDIKTDTSELQLRLGIQ